MGELEALISAIELRDGAIVTGAPGVGKTALVRAGLNAAAAQGHRVAWVPTGPAGIPFGHVAHLLPRADQARTDPLGAIRAVGDRLAVDGGTLVLGVDNLAGLDTGSAAFVHHLVTRGVAVLLTTAGTATQLGGVLWPVLRDGNLSRLALDPLDRDAVDQLIDAVLPPCPAPSTRAWIWRSTGGNPELLRALAADLGTRRLRRVGGLWFHDDLPLRGGRLHELVELRLAGLAGEARTAVELVALSDPLAATVLEALVDGEAIVAAERVGWIAPVAQSTGMAFRLSHPLTARMIRDALPASRVRAMSRHLISVSSDAPRTRRELMIRAGWQLDAALPGQPDLLLTAALAALAEQDPVTAGRFAAATGARPDGLAARTLAEALEGQGRHVEALRTLASAMPADPGESGNGTEGGGGIERGTTTPARWATGWACNVYWGLGAVDAALVTLDEADDPEGTARAASAWILLADGRCAEAARVAADVRERPAIPLRARVWAIAAGTAAAGLAGLAEARAFAGFAAALAAEDRPAGWGLAQLGWARCLYLLAAGRFTDARLTVESGYSAALEDGPPLLVAGWAGLAGLVAIAGGSAETAVERLSEAVGLSEAADPYRLCALWRSALAHATALGGDVAAARALLDRTSPTDPAPNGSDDSDGHVNRVCDPWLLRDRTWVRALAGDLPGAIELARTAADLARSGGQLAVEVATRYDMARLGVPGIVLVRLDELAERVAGEWAGTLADAARGLHRNDGPLLDRAGDAFDRAGADLMAAEAFAAAARAHRDDGRQARAATARERASVALRRCGHVRTPLIAPVDAEAPAVLTPRERQIAELARTGHASRDIASRLELSVRTVDNHLGRVYLKLGVTSRAELARALGAQPDGPE